MIKKNKIDLSANFIILISLIFIVAVLSENEIFQYIYIVYILQFLGLLVSVHLYYRKEHFVLSPSGIYLFYTNISFIVGALLFSIGFDFNNTQITQYFEITNLRIISILYIISNYLIYISYAISKKTVQNYTLKPKLKIAQLIFVIIGFFIFSQISIDLATFGGGGDFSLYPKTYFSLLLFYYLASQKIKSRFFFYAIILVLFASTHFSSKREVISLFFPIFLLEIFFGNIKPFRNRFRMFSYSIVSVVVIFIFIVSMSIMRGYGGFKVDNYFDSIKYLPLYIQSDYFSKGLIAHTEVTMAYFHSVDAVEIVLEDKNHLKFGSTLIKPFFLPIPRSIFPSKPESSVNWYSRISNPLFRSLNVTNPINIVSELFLNFHYLGLIPLFFIFYYFNNKYNEMINILFTGNILHGMFYLYIYTFLFALIRGSGFDLFVLAFIILLPIHVLLNKLQLFGRSNGY